MHFSLPSIKCSVAPPSFWMLSSTVSLSELCSTIWLVEHCFNVWTVLNNLVTAYSVRSWEELLNIWLTVAKNTFLDWAFNLRVHVIERCSKIQSNTIYLSMRLWGINPTNSVFIPQSLVLRSIVLGWILVQWNVVNTDTKVICQSVLGCWY